MSAIFGETLTFSQEKGPDVRLLVFGEIHEDLPPMGVGNLLGEISEELMRPPLQIHRNVEGVEIARLVFHLDFQQFLLRKNLFDDLPAERQSSRLTLEPLVLFEERFMFGLKDSQVIGFLGSQTLEHQPAPAVLRFS